MWGLGPPNKRIRVTNAMLANSRRWRGGLRRRAQYLCLFPSNLIHIMIQIASPFRFNLMCAGAHNVQKTGWLMCIRVHNQPAGIWGHSCCSL